MVADVYSHIIDEDRRLNAQRFEEAFYSRQGSNAPAEAQAGLKVENQGQEANGEDQINQELLLKLLQKPELAAMLKTLAQAI